MNSTFSPLVLVIFPYLEETFSVVLLSLLTHKMTTNYSEWNRWNEEEELLRVEQDWTLEEVSHELLHSEKRVISLLENLIQKIQNLSIALRSKVKIQKIQKISFSYLFLFLE